MKTAMSKAQVIVRQWKGRVMAKTRDVMPEERQLLGTLEPRSSVEPLRCSPSLRVQVGAKIRETTGRRLSKSVSGDRSGNCISPLYPCLRSASHWRVEVYGKHVDVACRNSHPNRTHDTHPPEHRALASQPSMRNPSCNAAPVQRNAGSGEGRGGLLHPNKDYFFGASTTLTCSGRAGSVTSVFGRSFAIGSLLYGTCACPTTTSV